MLFTLANARRSVYKQNSIQTAHYSFFIALTLSKTASFFFTFIYKQIFEISILSHTVLLHNRFASLNLKPIFTALKN